MLWEPYCSCTTIFAKDVLCVAANAMGPFSAIYSIWSTASITSKSKVPEWILVIGGGGIVAGLVSLHATDYATAKVLLKVWASSYSS